MFIEAFLIALFVMIASMDWIVLNIGLSTGPFVGLVIGLILGEPLLGLMYGGYFELVFLGMLAAGGAQPPNKLMGTALGVAFSILTKQEPGTAISIAFPAAVLMQAVLIFTFTAISNFMPKIDELAEAGDWKGVERHAIGGTVLMGSGFFIVTFVAIFFGTTFVEVIVENMPLWLTGGFAIAGRMLPAAGFAVVLNYFLQWKNSYYLMFGFALSAYFKLPPLGLAIVSVCVALIEYNIRQDIGTSKAPISYTEEQEDGI